MRTLLARRFAIMLVLGMLAGVAACGEREESTGLVGSPSQHETKRAASRSDSVDATPAPAHGGEDSRPPLRDMQVLLDGEQREPRRTIRELRAEIDLLREDVRRAGAALDRERNGREAVRPGTDMPK